MGMGSLDRKGSHFMYLILIYSRTSTPSLQHVGPVCVEFYYHMYGSTMGTLQLSADHVSMKPVAVWARAGEQGNKWIKAAVTVNMTDERQKVSKTLQH